MASESNIAMKTIFKMLDVNGDGRVSREEYLLYGERVRKALEQHGSDPVEAYFVYAALLLIADTLGLTKDAKDGGKSIDIQEFEEIRRERTANNGPLHFALKVLYTALFRAVDRDGNGSIDRKEWATYLKVRGTYVGDKQAEQSFDSIDKNKDGKLSMEEFMETAIDFWCHLGEKSNTENLFGTESN